MFNRFGNLRIYKTFKSLSSNKTLPNAFYPNLITRFPNYDFATKRLPNPDQQSTPFQRMYQENKEKMIQGTKKLVNLVIQATKDAYKDAKYLKTLSKSKPKENFTVQEMIEAQRIKKDLIKFVPYTAALTLPGGMVLLLFIKSFFPRGTPTYFMSEEEIKKQNEIYLKKQEKAQGELMEYLLAAMKEEGYDSSNRNLEDMKRFFVDHQESLLKKLDTRRMSSDMLKNASDFLMFEYIEGTYILNTVYRTIVNLPMYIYNLGMWMARKSYRAAWSHPIFNYKFQLNNFLLEDFKEELLRYQFEQRLKFLRAENIAMLRNRFGQLKGEDLLKVSQERGHHAQDEQDAKKWISKEWNSLVKENPENDMFGFWCSVMYYNH